MREWIDYGESATGHHWLRSPAAAKYGSPICGVSDRPSDLAWHKVDVYADVTLDEDNSSPYVDSGKCQVHMTKKVYEIYRKAHPELSPCEIGMRWCDEMLLLLGYLEAHEFGLKGVQDDQE